MYGHLVDTFLYPFLHYQKHNILSNKTNSTQTSFICINIIAGFYPSTFLYSCFFPKKLSFFNVCWVSRALRGKILKTGSPDSWKMHFWHAFWLQSTHCSLMTNIIFPREYYGLVIKYMKSYHLNWCIKVGGRHPRVPCW